MPSCLLLFACLLIYFKSLFQSIWSHSFCNIAEGLFYSHVYTKYIMNRLLPFSLLPSAALNRNHPVSKIKNDILIIHGCC